MSKLLAEIVLRLSHGKRVTKAEMKEAASAARQILSDTAVPEKSKAKAKVKTQLD